MDVWGLVDYGITSQIQQVGEQDGFVAFTAVPAEAKGTAENVVLFTTSDANLSLAADAALVHGVGHQRASAPKLSVQLTIVDGSELDVAQSERALAAGRRAIASSRAI